MKDFVLINNRRRIHYEISQSSNKPTCTSWEFRRLSTFRRIIRKYSYQRKHFCQKNYSWPIFSMVIWKGLLETLRRRMLWRWATVKTGLKIIMTALPPGMSRQPAVSHWATALHTYRPKCDDELYLTAGQVIQVSWLRSLAFPQNILCLLLVTRPSLQSIDYSFLFVNRCCHSMFNPLEARVGGSVRTPLGRLAFSPPTMFSCKLGRQRLIVTPPLNNDTPLKDKVPLFRTLRPLSPSTAPLLATELLHSFYWLTLPVEQDQKVMEMYDYDEQRALVSTLPECFTWTSSSTRILYKKR